MLSKTVGNVEFHFEPLIVILIMIAVIMVFNTIRAILLRRKGKRIADNIAAGNYYEVIKDGEKLQKVYKKYNARRSTKATVQSIEYLNFALAIAYFSKSDHERFLEHINALLRNDIKEFWLALFYLQQKDADAMKAHYDKINCSESTQVYRTFLDSVSMHRQGDFAAAQEKMKEIYPQLKIFVLKQIADEVFSSEPIRRSVPTA